MKPYLKELPYEMPRPKNLKVDRVKGPCVITEKLDGEMTYIGWNMMCGRRKSQRGVFENKWHMLPQRLKDKLTAALSQLEASNVEFREDIDDPKLWVAGELFIPGGTSTDVKHNLLEGGESIEFAAFYLPGLPAIKPIIQLQMLSESWFDVPWYDFPLNQEDMGEDSLLQSAESRGCEGYVLWENKVYPDAWRIKIQKTADLIITGIKPGNAGKYKGQCGSLILSWYVGDELVEVGKASGFDDATRASITEDDIGRVVEIEFNNFASKGRMRHARFIRWRDDKPPEDCKAEQEWIKKYHE